MKKVELISRELIKPSSPTPSHLQDFKLSFIDQKIPPFFVPLILYYTFSETSNPEIANRLKTSLANTLTDFYPLAGRIKDPIFVDCNDEGVDFSVTRVDQNLNHLIENPELESLNQLIPLYGTTFMDNEQLAIQVNFFKCGGLAIGLCVSHRIADGSSLSSFIKAWANKSRQDTNMARPIFNSATLFPPRNTPDFKANTKGAAVQPAKEKLVAKRFIFTPSAIAEMKSKVVNSSSITQPTRVEVVSALLWKCITADVPAGASASCLPVNLRGKMVQKGRTVQEIQGCSFGNIFQVATAVSNGDLDWISLVRELKSAIKKIDDGYIERLLGENGFELHTENFNEINGSILQGKLQVVRYSIWCNLGMYEADFGWGKPVWVSSAGFSCKDFIYLFDTKCSRGVEAWVVMAEEDMPKVEQDMELKLFT